MLEIAMLIFGIVTLVRGKFYVSKTKAAVGAPAYLAGIVLILPMPVSFGIVFMYGAMMAAEGRQIDHLALLGLEVVIVLICLAIAYIIGFSNARDVTKKVDDEDDYDDRRRRRDDPDVDEEEEEDYQMRRRRE